MDRLTLSNNEIHTDAGIWILKNGNPKELISDDCDEYEYFKKLAEYEDLEEQGKLRIFPCSIGDTVYRINKGAKQPIIPLQVLNFKIFNNNLVESFKMECVDEWDAGYSYYKTDIGRDVFITRPEAEAKLKG